MYATISEQIEAIKRKEIAYRNNIQYGLLTNEQTGTLIQIPFSNILRKYRYLLSSIIIPFDASNFDRARNLIRYNPKFLSNLLYGTTELWNELLIINGCASIIDFNKNIYNAYDTDAIKDALNEIMILEEII